MTTKTRYFVIASLLVLGVGLGTGLVAYYVGFPAGAATRAGGPEELQYIPHDATVIAFANVQDVMNSQLRQKLLQALPMHEAGQKESANDGRPRSFRPTRGRANRSPAFASRACTAAPRE